MLTTLYCDASWCHSQSVGGWATWLRSDQGRIVESGPTPVYVQNSHQAELAAIFAGLYRAVTQWEQTNAIVVRSDCQSALDAMKRGSHKLARKIQGLQKRHKVLLLPKWVKGHQGGQKTDAWLNRRVDEMAYQEMSKQRKK